MICFKGIANYIAEWIHTNGKQHYINHDYKRAITVFTRATIFFPKENIATCLTNRSACHIMLADYKSSLVDSRKAIEYDKTHEIAYERVITACLHLGDLEAVETAINQIKSINPNNELIQSTVNSCVSIKTMINEAEMNSRLKNFETAIEKIDLVLKITTACENSILLRETYLKARTAQSEATSILYEEANRYYTEAKLENCIIQLSEILVIDPYHKQAKKMMDNAKKFKDQKELGNLFFSQQKFLKAYQIYREALKIDPTNLKMQSTLHHNLAATNYNLLDYKQAVKDATAALKHNPNYIKALVVRAKCYFKLENYKESTIDCKSVLIMESNEKIETILKNCRLEESNQLFIKEASIRANSNFMISNFKDCIINCKQILDIKDIIDIRKLLENAELNESNRIKIAQMLGRARDYYKTQQYDMCVGECDKIREIQTNSDAYHLKENALKQIRNHKSLSDDMIHANNLFKNKQFKESKKYCNSVLDTHLYIVEAKRDQYKTEANYLLEKIRKCIEEIMFQAKYNFNLENFDRCIINCECILNIEESFEARNLLGNANSEKLIQADINDKIKRTRKYYESESFKNCITECIQILKIKEIAEARRILNKIRELIDKSMEEAKRNLSLKNFDLCIKECEKILNIEESLEARNLLSTAMIEKDICEKILRARKYFECESYKDCIQECNQIIKIREIPEVRQFLKNIREIIDKCMAQAKRNFNLEYFEQCIKSCEYILNIEESFEARNLLRNANSEKLIQADINDKIKRARKYYESESFKNCITECNQILKIKEISEARRFLNKIRELIDKLMEQAKRNFSFKNFDLCIKECEKILNIEESLEARNLLSTALIEKDICEKITRARKYFEWENYKDCIQECNQIIKIREIPEAKQFLKNIREIIDKCMAQAKRNFNLEYFEQCIKNCEYILKIEESQEAEDLLDSAKTENVSKSIINEGLNRARRFYKTKHYRECIKECRQLLRIKDVGEANNLIEICEAAIEAAQLQTTGKLMESAKKFYEMKNYKKCLIDCYKILHMVELKEARDLVKKIKLEKANRKYINDMMTRAKKHYQNKNYEECISECEIILGIEEMEEAKILMRKAKEEMNQKYINDIMSRAKQNFKNEKYKECISECLKVLETEDLLEAKILMKKAKTAIQNKVINEIMERVRRNFKNTDFKQCIVECEKALEVDQDFMEAKNLMEKARQELINASRNFVKNKMVQAKLQFDKAEFKNCVETCTAILEHQDVAEVNNMLKKSRVSLAYEKLTDNHEILEVPRFSDQIAIKSSYYALSMRYHPDKHSKSTKEMRTYCENLYKKITNAYRALSKK